MGMGERSSPKKRERKQLADLKEQLAKVNARLKTGKRYGKKREQLLQKKRVLKAKISLLDPDHKPPRYQTWGRWSKAPDGVRFYRGRGGN